MNVDDDRSDHALHFLCNRHTDGSRTSRSGGLHFGVRDEEADHFWFFGGLSPGFTEPVDGEEAFRRAKSNQGECRSEKKGEELF